MRLPSFLRSFVPSAMKSGASRRARHRQSSLPTNVPVLESRLLLTDVFVGFGSTPPTQVFNAATGDTPPLITSAIPFFVTGHADHQSTLTVTLPNSSTRIYSLQGPFSIPVIIQSDSNSTQTVSATLSDPLVGIFTSQATETQSSFSANVANLLKPAAAAIPPFISGIVNSSVPSALSPLQRCNSTCPTLHYSNTPRIPRSPIPPTSLTILWHTTHWWDRSKVWPARD